MPQQDTIPIKEKIINILKQRGPGLPVHIASLTGLNTLFASAFLSELVSDKRVKISNMRVGNSPLYFLPGQEPMLEKFVSNLNRKEKQAFDLLKERKFLKDIEQEPSIRVALRSMRDFSVPFRRNEEIYWRFYSVPEDIFNAPPKIFEKPKNEEVITEIIKKDEGNLGIFDEEEKKVVKKKKKSPSTKKELFFNQIKKYFESEKISIKDILKMGENYIILLVKEKESNKIVVAFNKKRISEIDLKNASKKAKEYNLPYILLSKGEPIKKITDLIESLKNLSEFRKIK
jgi:hypothetical protein